MFNPLKPMLAKGDNLGLTVVSKYQVSKFTGLVQPDRETEVDHPVSTVLLAALGIRIAVQRRKTLLRMAIGVILVTLVILAGISLGTDHVRQPGVGTT